MSNPTGLALLLPPLLLLGCADSTDWAAEIPPARATMLDRLQSGAELHVQPQRSSASLGVLWKAGDVQDATEIDLEEGSVQLFADAPGTIYLDSISFGIADLIISNDALASTIHLSEVSLRLDAPAVSERSEWSDDLTSASGQLDARLLLSWSLVTASGELAPLGEQKLDRLPVDFEIVDGADGIELQIAAQAEGTVWSWLGIVELQNLQFAITATELR